MSMGTASSQEAYEQLEGKIQEYLVKLNEVLTDYERQRVIESALQNIEAFNSLLQAFMDLPEVEQLMDLIKEEKDTDLYLVLTPELREEILALEQSISENQENTSTIFNKLDDIQRLMDCLKHQTLLGAIAAKKGASRKDLL